MSLISFLALIVLVAAFAGLAVMTRKHKDWRFGALATPILLFVVAEFGFDLTGGSEIVRVIVAGGAFLTFFIIERIIRDRAKLESSLRESEDKYRSFFESAYVGLTQVRISDAKLLDANDQAAHMFGYEDRRDMIANFDPSRHWIDLQAREPIIKAGLKGENIRDLVLEMNRLDGTRFWRRLSLTPFPEQDYVVAVDVDITENKLAEEELKENQARLDAALESFSDGFVLFDKDERFILSNNAYRKAHPKITELQLPGETLETITRNLANIGFYGNDPADAETIVRERLQSFRSGQPYEYLMADGRWYEMRHYKTGSGGTALVRNDITAGKRAERGLMTALETAQYASRAKSEFLANMSHELRTPLNAILGFSQVLQRGIGGRLNQTQTEYVTAVNESGKHLLNVINDILDLSKLEAGKAEIEENNVIVPLAIDQMLVLVNQRAEEGKVDLRSEVSDNLPLLRADERMFKQMILNLLSNAVKFTPEGGKVKVSAALVDDNGLSISVSDNGIGMTKADIGKAISTFGQVDGDLDRRHEGTGLGLPLVKSLVELHGGKLVIESEQGKGTKGTLLFPHERTIETQWSHPGATPEPAEK